VNGTWRTPAGIPWRRAAQLAGLRWRVVVEDAGRRPWLIIGRKAAQCVRVTLPFSFRAVMAHYHITT